MSRPIIFVGVVDGHLTEPGELTGPHEVDEFVESCQNAGWDSVVVIKGAKVLRKWRRAAA